MPTQTMNVAYIWGWGAFGSYPVIVPYGCLLIWEREYTRRKNWIKIIAKEDILCLSWLEKRMISNYQNQLNEL